MLRWLHRAGMMRRAKEPDEAMIAELFAQTAGRFSCPQCGRAGLIVEDAGDDGGDEAWGMARRCAGCGRPIPPERLEVFPAATHCAACQSSVDSPDADEPDYCARCGSIMTLRATRTGGVQRYAMTCPQCGRVG